MHTVLHAGHADRIVINECKWVCVNKQKRSSRLYRLKSNMKPKGRKQLWAALCWRWQSVPDVSFAKQNVVLSLVRPEGAVKKYFRFEHKSQLCVSFWVLYGFVVRLVATKNVLGQASQIKDACSPFLLEDRQTWSMRAGGFACLFSFLSSYKEHRAASLNFCMESVVPNHVTIIVIITCILICW